MPRPFERLSRTVASLAAIVVAFLAALLALDVCPSFAAALSGFVRETGSGESVAYANVFARGAGGGKVALCNAEGFYSIPDLPAGTVRLSVQAIGYKTFADSLQLGEGEALRRDIALEVAPVELLEIEVKGEVDREEQTLQTGFIALEARRLQRLPAVAEADLIRSLQLLPGIQAASDVSSGLYIRGGGPDQTLILLDQVPLYNPTHAFGFFSTFNPDAIKDVNLYKGAYPARYAGRLGSVLEVTNREGDKSRVTGRGGVSLLAARLTLEGPVGRGSWIASGRRTYLEPLLSALRTESNEIPAYYFYDANVRVTQELGPSDRVTISGYFGRDDLDLNLDEGSFIDIRWGNAAGTAKWTHLFSSTVFGSFLLAGTDYTSRTKLSFFETPILFSNGLRDLSLQGDFEWHPGGAHVLTTGVQTSRYDFRVTQSFNQNEQGGLHERPFSISYYAQDEWRVSPSTTARTGLHIRSFSEGNRFIAEPRFSLSRALSDSWRVKFGAGGYHQFLQLVSTEGFNGGDLWVPSDETVDPGRSWQSVAGVEWEPTSEYHLSAEAYYTKLDRLVQFDNDVAADAGGTSSEDLFKTGGRGFATGLELFAERRVGPVTGWIGYGLGWSRRTFDELNGGRAFSPKYDRRHDLKLVGQWKRGKWSYGSDFIYATGQAFTPAGVRYSTRNPVTGYPPEGGLLLPAERNSARLLPYHRLDVSAARETKLFGRKAEWFFQVFNLYSRRNDWFVEFDTEKPAIEAKVVKQLPIIPSIGVNFEL